MEKIPRIDDEGKEVRPSRRQARGFLRIASCILVATLGAAILFSDFGELLELRAYDTMLRVLPPVDRDDDIVILAIDDASVDAVGSWPWSRDVLGDGLILLSTLGVRHVVLDIAYPNPSPVVVDAVGFQQDLDSVFGGLGRDLDDLAVAMESGQLGNDATVRVLSDLANELVSPSGTRTSLTRSLTDRDLYMGNAVAATAATVLAATWSENPNPDRTFAFPPLVPRISLEIQEFVTPAQAMDPERGIRAPLGVPRAASVAGPIPQIAQGAAGVGFVNNVLDQDGVTRRSNLLVETEAGYLPTLGLVPLMLEGYTDVLVTNNEYVLSNGEDQLVARRSDDGTVLVRWHRGQIQEGFETVSYSSLIEMDQLLQDIYFNLNLMADAGYLAALENGPQVFVPYRAAAAIKERMVSTGDTRLMDQYAPRIATFVSDASAIVDEESERFLLDIVDQQPASDARDRVRAQIVQIFEATRSLVDRYGAIRSFLVERLSDATVFVGFTAASTSDLGVTPFEEAYLNVGLHATVLRTLRNESSLDWLPSWFGLLVFLVTMVALALSVELLSPRLATGIGISLVLAQFAIAALSFRFAGLYLPVATSAILTFVAFALVTALTYVMTERDKREIRQAFEHYLSPNVINALLEDPAKLNVGGEMRELTAMFTDVERFSSLVDKLAPGTVVDLLGDYLSAMTEPILDTDGTIDKYEGDGIISFFGAPLEDPQHARHAVDAAIAMRRLEPVLNDRLVRSGRTPVPLRTRIGIHTGPMTVGNLGTAERLDYTIIGAEVNLASRLENVNKQYGTLSIISEETYNAAGEGLLVRRLDRVRVYGIDRPVRLYELLGYANDSTSALRESLDIFEEGLTAFEDHEWERACELFVAVRRIYPTDGPAELFTRRCERFKNEGVRESWDGIISLTEK